MSDRPPVLLVVDDLEQSEFLTRALKLQGSVHPEVARSGAEALQRLSERRYAVMVAEVFLKGLNGIELLKRAQPLAPSTQTVLVGRDVPAHTVVTAMKQGAFDFVERPIDVDYFLLVVGKAIDHHRLRQENQTLKLLNSRHTDDLVAESQPMKEVLKTIELVAPSDLTVLIEGESGVGKELVANRIHALSARSGQPFVAVNCGAIQESLLESELFGHVKGAFTGATRDHEGLFAVADGGTLFLDEVGEMNLDLQVKLLRVLERSEFRRVGGNKLVRVDVRVVAATNKRLTEEVAAGRFREDLYYRLNVIHLEVPALRSRLEDIPALVETFLAAQRKKGLPRRTFSDEAMVALKSHGWPGNVRELRNVIERCLILARGDVVQPSDLPTTVSGGTSGVGVIQTDDGRKVAELVRYDVELPLAEVERQHILRVLEVNDGNKLRTAKSLGINVKTLYNKLKSYGLQVSKKG